MSDDRPDSPAETGTPALRALAELLGRLLTSEVDSRTLGALRAAPLAEPLGALGVVLPEPAEEDAWLEERAADFHDLFLRSARGPLVQSLWTQGRFEGDATAQVRALADAAGLEFQREATRGAPPDHLGNLLLLWAATDGRAPDIARAVEERHLPWARTPLRQVTEAGGFYGCVASLVLGWLDELGAPSASKT